jgi:hypothetical protein
MWQSLEVPELSLETATNWITIPDAAEALGIPFGKVHRLIEDNYLIETRINGIRMIPAEAIQDGEPLPHLRGTIVVLLDSGFTLPGAVEWLYTLEPSLGTTPMDALVAGKRAEIRRIAQALAF